MIHIRDNYYIVAEDTQYKVVKDTKKVDKNGATVYKVLGYYTSVNTALKCCRDILYREAIREGEFELDSAIERFDELTRYLNDKIDKAVKDK